MKVTLALLAVLAAPVETSAPYAEAAGRILEAERTDGQAWAILQHLTDRIGPRLSGSPGAEASVVWTLERLRSWGLDARTEPVIVPRWVRGIETAEVVAPVSQRLVVTALGGSDPTPPGGVTAEVVEVRGFDELKSRGEAVRGKIVLFNRAMRAGFGGPEGYGSVASLRTRGAIEAAKLGAVATLLRSIGTASLRTPHTGLMNYEEGVPRIPGAAVSAEDADLLHRLLASGEPVRVRLELTCRSEPDVPSANVVADLRGREKPEDVVLIGAHLDSWDLGTGAIDDGAGVAMVMETLRLLKALGLRPRRTLRGVLFMNEENGLRGAIAYAERHKDALARHVVAIEADSGAARPTGFGVSAGPGGLERVREIARLLEPLGATEVTPGGGGADISRLRPAGVPLLGLLLDPTRYFDYHHSPADTLDKVDPAELARGTAALAVMAYALAEMPDVLPRLEPAPREAR
jgi:hypothetical protein